MESITAMTGVTIDGLRTLSCAGDSRRIRAANAKKIRSLEVQCFVDHNPEIVRDAEKLLEKGASKREIVTRLGVHPDAIFKMLERKA